MLYGNSSRNLASSEGDDAPDGIVGRNPDGDAVTRHHLDSEAAHSTAQLGEHLVSLIALHAIKPAAVNRHDCALHINQIILAQLLSFQSKIVPYRGRQGNLMYGSRLESRQAADGLFDALG